MRLVVFVFDVVIKRGINLEKYILDTPVIIGGIIVILICWGIIGMNIVYSKYKDNPHFDISFSQSLKYGPILWATALYIAYYNKFHIK